MLKELIKLDQVAISINKTNSTTHVVVHANNKSPYHATVNADNVDKIESEITEYINCCNAYPLASNLEQAKHGVKKIAQDNARNQNSKSSGTSTATSTTTNTTAASNKSSGKQSMLDDFMDA
ncbi:hypothetical protein [Photobacterium leiognathi]|uniref:hypothetical protein n=1 Tax=Photobacterium leiognathi TaxID=553611 RepID=UPI0029821976|nr:hypothetical protein [Photobacterium leiognathi]